MTYMVKRNDRFYAVVYDGMDALTGRERRRWHPVGTDRHEAEAVVTRLRQDRVKPPLTPEGLDHLRRVPHRHVDAT